MDLDALLRHRSDHDLFLKEHYASPLPEEHQSAFEGLDYLPPDPEWVLSGVFHPGDDRAIPIPSSAGTESEYTMVGEVALSIAGTDYRLVVLDDGDGGRFIPFRDMTAGDTTYAGGRYVGVDHDEEGTATVDFNRSGNPWCVYDDEFICPLPPPSNVIASPVTAGEKLWRASD